MKKALIFTALACTLSLSGCDNSEPASSIPPAIETVGTPISESEIGIAFYPGAKANDQISTKLDSSLGNAKSVKLKSSDPVEKIVAFYREKMKSVATDKQFLENKVSDSEVSLLLADEKNRDSILVTVTRNGAESEIGIVTTRSKK